MRRTGKLWVGFAILVGTGVTPSACGTFIGDAPLMTTDADATGDATAEAGEASAPADAGGGSVDGAGDQGSSDGGLGPEAEASDALDTGPDVGNEAGDAGSSACATLAFEANPAVISSLTSPGIQNIPAGVTPTGSTILVQRAGQGVCSSGLSLFVGDESPAGSGVYQSNAVPALSGMDTSFEENATLTADGLTIIALNQAHTGFLASTRSGAGLVDFGPPVALDFEAIAATGSQTLWAPVISADGLAFYYVVQNDPSANANGIYESIRSSESAPFPAGTRMPAIVQNVSAYVTGLSTDRLTIFLASDTYTTVALTRASTSDPFTNPLAPNPPPLVPGLRAHPLVDCRRLIGTCATPNNGCAGEQICSWDGP
jgi:hypothetical protein